MNAPQCYVHIACHVKMLVKCAVEDENMSFLLCQDYSLL
jgi:hypothetical protein